MHSDLPAIRLLEALRRAFRLVAVAAFPLLLGGLWACDSAPQVAGTGSQSGNFVVAGRILPTDSAPSVGGVAVYLRPLRWTSGQSAPTGKLQETRTDSVGNYRFQDVPRDTYRIEAAATRKGWSRTVRALQDSNAVLPGNLQAWGKLVVEIEVSDSMRGGRVEFYGLNRYVDIPPGTSDEVKLRIDSLPVGLQTVRIYLPSLSKMFCEAPIRIGPDSVSTIEYEGWDSSNKGPFEDD